MLTGNGGNGKATLGINRPSAGGTGSAPKPGTFGNVGRVGINGRAGNATLGIAKPKLGKGGNPGRLTLSGGDGELGKPGRVGNASPGMVNPKLGKGGNAQLTLSLRGRRSGRSIADL